MAYSSAELRALLPSTRTAEVEEALAASARMEFSRASLLSDTATLRGLCGEMGRAVTELVSARRALGRKMRPELASEWMTDHDATQQATPEIVAAWRAAYLRRRGMRSAIDLTCSIGTELWAGTDAGLAMMGCDLDPMRVQMAAANLAGREVPLWCGDALDPASAVGERVADVALIDPPRRSSSGRLFRMEDFAPFIPEVLERWRDEGRVGEIALKFMPGISMEDAAALGAQVDLISVDREVKEALILSSGLCAPAPAVAATDGVEPRVAEADGGEGEGFIRRAIVLSSPAATLAASASHEAEAVSVRAEQGTGAAAVADVEPRGWWAEWTVEVWDSRMPEIPEEHGREPGRYLIDPDGAIVRAGLVRHYAAAHGLWQIDPRIAYLTGDAVPEGTRGFEILDTAPVKKVRPMVGRWAPRSVEILVRGVDVNPDQVRAGLRLRAGKGGSGEDLSLVISRVGRSAVAYLCRPVRARAEGARAETHKKISK